jgi:hypothetical protein
MHGFTRPPAVPILDSPSVASRAVTGLLLLGSAVLCGVRLPQGSERTLAFEAFGFVEGVLALLVLFLFLRQGALAPPARAFDRLLLAYWLFATAVLLRLALPPPGLGYWIGAGILGAALLGAFGGDDRRRSLFTLGVAVALCGTIRFGVIPFLWRNATLPDLGPLRLEGVTDWAKGLVTDYQPVRAGNEVLNVAGVALYAVALWRSWPAEWPLNLPGLAAGDRERLLTLLARAALAAELPALARPAVSSEPPSPAGPSAPVGEPKRAPADPQEPPPSDPRQPPAERREPPPDPRQPPAERREPPAEPGQPHPGSEASVREPEPSDRR